MVIGSPSLHSTLSDDLAQCVSCGLCLAHCPTFRVTGEEGQSPRGRIAIIKDAYDRAVVLDENAISFLDSCVQCRGCEPACPSGVPYGRILEAARSPQLSPASRTPFWKRIALGALRRPHVLGALSRVGLVAQRSSSVRRYVGLPSLPFRQGKPVRLDNEYGDVWLFTGCIMNTWFRSTHRATLGLIDLFGERAMTPRKGGECCGALHLHSGDARTSQEIALQTMASMPGEEPIVVDSAGCGAMLKEYGDLLGSEEARTFSARIVDVHEWLAPRMPVLITNARRRGHEVDREHMVIVQDPCHLRHVQKARGALYSVLSHVCTPIELDDDGLCCGAGGLYSRSHPDMAASIRNRKRAAIARADSGRGLDVLTSNPGCHIHLNSGGVAVRQSVEFIAEALGVDGSIFR